MLSNTLCDHCEKNATGLPRAMPIPFVPCHMSTTYEINKKGLMGMPSVDINLNDNPFGVRYAVINAGKRAAREEIK